VRSQLDIDGKLSLRAPTGKFDSDPPEESSPSTAVEFTAINCPDHISIGIDARRCQVTKDLVQLSVTIIALEVRQNCQLLRFEKVAIANRNEIVIDHMQHETPESHTIGNGAPFPSDSLQMRAAFGGILGPKRQLGIAVFRVFESDKRLGVTQCFEPQC
jgi:hypothetical protein